MWAEEGDNSSFSRMISPSSHASMLKERSRLVSVVVLSLLCLFETGPRPFGKNSHTAGKHAPEDVTHVRRRQVGGFPFSSVSRNERVEVSVLS